MSAALFALLLASCTSATRSLQTDIAGLQHRAGPRPSDSQGLRATTTAGPDFAQRLSDATLPQRSPWPGEKPGCAQGRRRRRKASDSAAGHRDRGHSRQRLRRSTPRQAPAKLSRPRPGEAAAPAGPAKLPTMPPPHLPKPPAALRPRRANPRSAASCRPSSPRHPPRRQLPRWARSAAAPAAVAAQAKPVVASADPAGPPPSVKVAAGDREPPCPAKAGGAPGFGRRRRGQAGPRLAVGRRARRFAGRAPRPRCSRSSANPASTTTAMSTCTRTRSVGPVQLASAAGMARLAPNGLLTQTEKRRRRLPEAVAGARAARPSSSTTARR